MVKQKQSQQQASATSRKKVAFVLLLILGTGLLSLIWYLAGQQNDEQNALKNTDPNNLVTEYRAYLAEHPEDTFARLNLGKTLMQSDATAALAEFQQITDNAPEYVESLNHITTIYIRLGKPDLAKQTLRRLEEHLPEDPELQAQLSEYFYNQKEYETALLHAMRRAVLRPESIEALIRVAEINADLDRHVDMITPLKKVIELNPDHFRAHINLANAYYQIGQLDLAANEANWCLKLNPDEAFCYRILAAVARDQGELESAQEYLEQALKRAPDNLYIRILEADLLMFEKQTDQAYQRLKPLYELHKTKGEFLAAFARAAAASGRRDEAQKLYEELKRIP